MANEESPEASQRVGADEAYTNWSILGSGEAGTRVASLYFLRHAHASIKDRVLLLNSNEGDLRNVLQELKDSVVTEDQRGRYETAREHTTRFGREKTGAGNNFWNGEQLARDDFDSTIRHRIADVIQGFSDVVVSIAGLGGGTGNGSVPYLIYEMKHGDTPIASEDMHHFSVAIWPYDHESVHRQFNAVCGFSRLLRYGNEGPGVQRNADAVVLCDNSTLVELVEEETGREIQGYSEINERILEIVDGLISPSRRAIEVIDAKDYVEQPHEMGVQHFTAGLSLDNHVDLLSVEGALDIAAEKTVVPMDPETALATYCVVEVPEGQVGEGEFTPDDLGEILDSWTRANTSSQVVYKSIVPSNRLSNTFNVLLFLGGFDLEPFLEGPLEAFDRYKQTKEISKEGLQGGEKKDLEEDLRKAEALRERLETYLSVNARQREALAGG